MISRATSLDGLVILTPFPKQKICCRQSEDLRLEFRRLRYHALRTIQASGTREEADRATSQLLVEFATNPAPSAAETEDHPSYSHPRERLALDTPIGASESDRSVRPSQPSSSAQLCSSHLSPKSHPRESSAKTKQLPSTVASPPSAGNVNVPYIPLAIVPLIRSLPTTLCSLLPPRMFLEVIIKDVYLRLLDQLCQLPVLLLATSALGQDFVHCWVFRRPSGAGDSVYALPDGTSFEPLLVGSVESVDHRIIILRTPPYPTPEMELLCLKQLSCFENAVNARCRLSPGVSCEDVIPWSYGSTVEDGRIHLLTSADTPIRSSAPHRCLDGLPFSVSPPSSVCSTSSSSTLSSTNDCAPADTEIKRGDLVVV
ncbi:hypothetical protein C8F04DRAFT_1279772 [Mycena alexandri]|uniref:Uncharacterized protein n=1 Tax=Mycena alexandri TaxID=1745969 RepID=A0AAD6RXP7_9AGAR|nr:hypothetical protein C8F04DRAFT_1279772 [Mycena alexandri]